MMAKYALTLYDTNNVPPLWRENIEASPQHQEYFCVHVFEIAAGKRHPGASRTRYLHKSEMPTPSIETHCAAGNYVFAALLVSVGTQPCD